jgi:hypothetical protein
MRASDHGFITVILLTVADALIERSVSVLHPNSGTRESVHRLMPLIHIFTSNA